MVDKTFKAATLWLLGAALMTSIVYQRRTRGHDKVDPELRSLLSRFRTPSFGPWLVSIAQPLMRLTTRCVDGVSVAMRQIDGPDGQPLTVAIYRPDDLKPGRGAMLYSHGGGLVSGSVGSHQRVVSAYARDLGILVVSTEYRLAPKHPFPAALDDIQTAYRWMNHSAPELAIDPARIVVAGESAGGGLTAALCQRIYDSGDPAPILQLLIYPMLDDRTAITPPDDDTGQIVWSRGSNLFGWSSYLGRRPGEGPVPEYAVPSRRETLRGLPPAWIGVGTLDLFHREDVDYAQRLNGAGVACKLVEIDGAYHGFDAVHPQSQAAKRFRSSALQAVREALSGTP